MPKKRDLNARALAAHKKLHGKVTTVSKIKFRRMSDFSLYYTPGVGAVSTYIASHPDKACEYTIKRNTVAVISDGSAVLGLGNIGPYGALPVMEGKAAIFKSCANIDAVPIVLDTQDPKKVVETILAIAPAFGGINLEDIAAPQCFAIESELTKRLSIPVMHDDQHGTAVVVLAGIINALKVVKKKKQDVAVTILGAGAAGTASALLLAHDGFPDIVVVDRQGVIGKARKGLAPHKRKLASLQTKRRGPQTLAEAVAGADILIALSGANTVSEAMIHSMAPHAIVFALANPTPEIMPPLALRAGAAVVATGRSDFPNQVNNALVFPGIFRGALDYDITTITDDIKIRAAYALANLITKPTATKIIPSVLDPRVVPAVARSVKRLRK